MPKTLLALVATKGTYTGPWQRSKGIERHIVIENLGEREVIVFEYQTGQDIKSFELKQNGSFPFKDCSRYRVIKVSIDEDSPETNVKIDIGD